MTLLPIFQPDGFDLIVMLLRFSAPEAVAALFWFPIRLLSRRFGGMVMIVMI